MGGAQGDSEAVEERRIERLQLFDVSVYGEDDRTDPDRYAHVTVATVARR